MEVELPPNQTIYVNNLNEKVKCEALKAQLTEVFEPFGKIIEIIAMKSFARRGQAFVVFEDITSASNAMQKMQGFELHPDKAMRINYARSKSDVISKADGTFVPREKKPLPPKRTAEGEEGGAPKRAAMAVEEEAEAYPAAEAPPQMAPPQMQQGGPPIPPPGGAMGAMPYGAPSMPYGGAPPAAYGMAPPQMGGQAAPPAASLEPPPNKILFLTELPEDTNEMLLTGVFDQFPGFKEVRLIPGRQDIAFIEYDTEAQAAEARTKLQGYKVKETHALQIAFAKK